MGLHRDCLAARAGMAIRCVLFAASLGCMVSAVDAQVLLDRVLARVSGGVITLSDVRAGLAMGLVVAREDELDLATEQWIQRQLLLLEVARFPPPEPDSGAIDQEEARIRSRLGQRVPALAARTGLDDRQVRQAARDTLRIRAYLDQRFGLTVQVSDDEVRAYYAAHPAEFMRDGAVVPFEQAEPEVRQRAAGARRESTIDQWMADLRQRADVVMGRSTRPPAQP
jgi:hypothetical protein